jgi:hypothetical protein
MLFTKLSNMVKINEAWPTQWIARLHDNRLLWVEYNQGMLRISKSLQVTDDPLEAINGVVIYNLCLSHDIQDSYIQDYDLFRILEELEILRLNIFEWLYYSFRENIWLPIKEAFCGPEYFFVVTSEENEDEDTEEYDG